MLSRFAVLSVSLTLKASPIQGQSGTGYTNRGNVVRGNTFENIRMTDLHPNQGSFGNMNVQGFCAPPPAAAPLCKHRSSSRGASSPDLDDTMGGWLVHK